MYTNYILRKNSPRLQDLKTMKQPSTNYFYNLMCKYAAEVIVYSFSDQQWNFCFEFNVVICYGL